MEPPSKKLRTLLDDSSSESEGENGGVRLNGDSAFKINEEYARRFEYNKKREEKQQLEAKLGKSVTFDNKRARDDDDASDGSDESSSEEEDEEGELVTEDLDKEIMATLNAIRSKDPRVYDNSVTFYSKIDEDASSQPTEKKEKEKPMTLRDYHRENLLKGTTNGEDEEEQAPKSFAQEQEDLKKTIVKEMHAAADDSDEEDDGFLVQKSVTMPPPEPKKNVELDIENADKDPETFLSNFMAAKAWIPADRSNELKPFESDDEEEDQKAELFEEAYNFRFEDPNKVNEKLITHARDVTKEISVRREEKSSRKKRREAEQQKREEEKKQREAEKNRLRKLKMEELEGKIKKIKQAAGIRASEFTDEDWARFLDDNFDDKQWEEEMQKRFGEEYYAEQEEIESGDEDGRKKKRKPKKPTWDDDIDITDLVPDFEDEDDKPDVDMDAEDGQEESAKSKGQERREKKREARKEKMLIEEAVDRTLDLDPTLLPGATKKNAGRFRYRETSPTSYGLTARDILMADDSQLNQFAGLKKLAPFRDPEKKRRDQKKLGKKARVRQWRKDTFGDEEGPKWEIPVHEAAAQEDGNGDEMKVDIREGGSKKKRKRSKKH
ncbi:Kinetochore protein Spc24 [Paecilomyces lecythidis]|uniref:Kinetochore protein Spc24 n=1 Tax=Paecilomyces lecythidis TaxID=3004212 RepID=A0ABR3XJZ2_9EURO